MIVVWSPTALRHLVSIRAFIEKDSETNAVLVAGRILSAIDLVQTHLHLGRPGRLPGTRELVITGTPYIVPYRVRHKRLELPAVFDGRRQWPRRF
jgi:toxin ParE1/3/4